jgi:hypothetical protein
MRLALITGPKYTSLWAGGVPPSFIKDRASDFQLSIPSTYLSKPYDLKNGDIIKGKILKVEDTTNKKEYSELRDQPIEFVLYTIIGLDYLFISKRDWENLFREYGLVVAFYISLRLELAIRSDGTEIILYSKKDLIL